MELSCFNWLNKGIPLKEFEERRNIQIKKESELKLFNEMMGESGSIRRQLITSKRPSGWGQSQGRYSKKSKKDLPKKSFADGPFMYKGKIISDEEAKKIIEEYNQKNKTI